MISSFKPKIWPNKTWSGWAGPTLLQSFGESESSLSTRPPLKQTLGRLNLLRDGANYADAIPTRALS